MASINRPGRLLGATVFALARILYRPEVRFEDGRKSSRVPLNEPALIVCNHIAHVDGSIIAYIFRDRVVHNLAAKDRFEQGGFVKWYLEKSGCIPIDRKGVSTDWLHLSVRSLTKEKESVVIFPEGRHGHDKEILPFHSGATMIAAFSGAPIVMVYNDGPYKIGRKCRLAVSEPFRLPAPEAGLTADYISAQTEALRERMLSLQKTLE